MSADELSLSERALVAEMRLAIIEQVGPIQGQLAVNETDHGAIRNAIGEIKEQVGELHDLVDGMNTDIAVSKAVAKRAARQPAIISGGGAGGVMAIVITALKYAFRID